MPDFPELAPFMDDAPRRRAGTVDSWLEQEMRRERDNQVRRIIIEAPPPDEVARTTVMAREAGIPPAFIEGRLNEAETARRAQTFAEYLASSTAMTRWAAQNPRGAVAASDDTESLGLLGDGWEVLKKIGYRLLAGTLDSLGGLLDAGSDPMVMRASGATGAADLVEALNAAGIGPERLTHPAAESLRVSGAGFRERGRAENWLADAALSGIESVPIVAAAALTRNPTVATAVPAFGVYGSSVDRARDQGLSREQARLYGAAQGGIEYATERLPMGTLVEAIVKRTPFGKAVVRQMLTELPGEQVATATQDLVDWAMLPENENKTFGDYLAERPDAAIQTAVATVSGTATQTALARSVAGAADATGRLVDRMGEAQRARMEREAVEDLARGAEGSKLRQRDPEAFRELERQRAAEAGVSDVFIPGEAVTAYQQSDSYDRQDDPFSRYDVGEAAASGGDIVIPIEDFLTDIVGTAAWNAVKDDVRLTPGGLSAREAQAFTDSIDETMASMSDQAAVQDQAEQKRAGVREAIVDRVAGMFAQSYTAPVARQHAEVVAQRMQARAARLGVDLTEEMLDGFAVRQVMPEGVAEAVKADQLDLVINALRQGKPVESGVGPSLLDFIASRGGINDSGGDLAAMGVPAKYLRDFDPRQTEMTGGLSGAGDFGLDSVLRAAIEAGYFPDLANVENEAGPSTLDTQRLLDALAEEAAGRPVFAETRTDPMRAAAEDLRAMLDASGLSPDEMSDAEVRAAVEGMASGAQEGRAFEQSDPSNDNDDGRDDSEDAEGGIDALNSMINFLTGRAPLAAMYEKGDVLQSGGRTADVVGANNTSLTLKYRDDGSIEIVPRKSDDIAPAPTELWQEARGRIVFDGAKRTIELFQSRNLSTALHELSHMWLEELAADASLPGTPAQLKADWKTVKAYFAANGHKIGKDGQIPTEAHELWARSGERYFMEGKAPSSALTRLFESFRSWLVGIYKTVDRLRAPITPEIREVFDRLLATDEEIAAARERQGLDALFKDAASAGMSEAEFDAYQRQVDGARAEAHASLIDKTMKAVRRRETERYREARKSVRQEEQERIDASPLYKALASMRDNRVSREWIVDNMGEDALGLLPVRVPPLYVEGGADPNVIAEQSGYVGAQDMLEAVIGAERAHRAAREGGDKRSMRERAIETATNEEMNRRWGDPLNDGSIEREALAAVNSEMQGEVIASELRVLSRKTGRRPTPYALAREWARGKVRAGMVKDEASPAAIQRYARNIAKAGRAAEQAILAGDAEEAFRQKQFQMLNSALLVSAKEALDAVDAAVRRMDRIARAKTRESVDQDYLEQAHALLEAVDLKKRSQASIERQGKWEEFAAARQAEGYDVVVPPSFEATINKTNWSRLPVEQLLALDEAVKQVIHLGRLKQTLLDNKERRDFDEVVREAIDGMDGMRRKPPSDLMEPSGWDQFKSKVASFDAALLKMETVFDWLDRGNSNGVFNRVVFRPLAEAQEQARVKMGDLLGKLNDALAEVPKETLRRWPDKVKTELLNRETGRPWVLTREQLVSIALNMGNRGNIDKLVGGYGWNEGAVREVLNRELSKEEWDYVQKVWDTIDSLWPEIEALEKRVNGVAPEKVEAAPVETPHGALRGGYYPAVYDPRKNRTSEKHSSSDLFENLYTRATTPKGFTKARTDVQRPIHLSLNVIGRHVAEVVHDITHREAVMQADKFLSSDRVQAAVDETLGPEVRKAFRPWLQRIANQWAYDRAGMAGIEGFLNKMRTNATVVGMGFRLTTMLVQGAGYANSFEVVGERWVAPRLKDAANPAAWKFVLEKSQEVAGRMESLDRDISDAAKRAAGGKKLNAATRFAFHGIGLMDRVVTIPTWLGAYDKAQAQGMSEQDAIYAADKAVRQSQGSGAAKDLAAIQAGRGTAGALGKYLTMFYSFMSAFYQRQRTLGRDVRDARPKDVPRLMARAWWLLIAAPLLSEILAGRGPGDDDDDETWASWALQAVAGQFMGPIPIARDVVPILARKFKDQSTFGYRFTPAQGGVDAFLRLADNVERLWDGKETKDGTRNVIELTGYVTGSGLATGQIAAATQFLIDVGAGDADPEGFADWWEGLTSGRIKED